MERDFFNHHNPGHHLSPPLSSARGGDSGSGGRDNSGTIHTSNSGDVEAQLKDYVIGEPSLWLPDEQDAQPEQLSFQHAWELQSDCSMRVYVSNDKELKQSKRARVARYVAKMKEVRETIALLMI